MPVPLVRCVLRAEEETNQKKNDHRWFDNISIKHCGVLNMLMQRKCIALGIVNCDQSVAMSARCTILHSEYIKRRDNEAISLWIFVSANATTYFEHIFWMFNEVLDNNDNNPRMICILRSLRATLKKVWKCECHKWFGFGIFTVSTIETDKNVQNLIAAGRESTYNRILHGVLA